MSGGGTPKRRGGGSSSRGKNSRTLGAARHKPQHPLPSPFVTQWTPVRRVMLALGLLSLASLVLVPILYLEQLDATSWTSRHHLSVQRLFLRKTTPQQAATLWVSKPKPTDNNKKKKDVTKTNQPQETSHHANYTNLNLPPKQQQLEGPSDAEAIQQDQQDYHKHREQHAQQNAFDVKAFTLRDLQPDPPDWRDTHSVARGVAGVANAPAMVGAKRAHIRCADNFSVDSLAYWNDPPGDRDRHWIPPFGKQVSEKPADPSNPHADTKYISFSPDHGGWNNVRMCMEIIFVLAAATGRTVVLPPKEPLYLLKHDKAQKYKGFGDFFPIETEHFQQRLPVISFAEFLKREGGPTGRLPVPEANRTSVEATAQVCEHMKRFENHCDNAYNYLKHVGTLVNISSVRSCVVFDKDVYSGASDLPTDPAYAQYINVTCGPDRDHFYWKAADFDDKLLLHFDAGNHKHYRLLAHFYAMIHFTDPVHDHHYRRFVRDMLHYHDTIWCAAGKVVKAVQAEGVARGFKVDENGAGAYSALHVRRGDLQYKKVKIPAQEWYDNTKEVWLPNEILYVATDERNKTFFDDLAKYHTLRFLDDYWELAGLGELDGNYMGMIDTIVASRSRAFAGSKCKSPDPFICSSVILSCAHFSP